jgi:hypothetical protein
MLREDAGGVYPEYSKGPVRSMSEEVLAGDVATAKTILRDNINALRNRSLTMVTYMLL